MMKQKTRKKAALWFATLLTATTLTGCAGKPSDAAVTETPAANTASQTEGKAESKPAEKKHFSIGYLPSTGHLLYFVAKEEGFFEAEGLDAELQLFDSNNNMLSSLESGKLDSERTCQSEYAPQELQSLPPVIQIPRSCRNIRLPDCSS